jgi:DNA-binding response OmpR family regulator
MQKDHVLILEDDQDVLQDLPRSLQKYEFQVTTTSDCSEAVRRVRDGIVKSVILDSKLLPDSSMRDVDIDNGRLTGVEVCRRIRQIQRHVHILVFTTVSDEKSHALLRDAGADEIIAKPADPEEVARRLLARLGFEAPKAARIEIEPIRLEPWRLESVAADYHSLAKELLEELQITAGNAAHRYRIMGFIQRFSDLEKKKLPETLFTFLVIDLTDYCDGLPSCPRIVETLSRVYEESNSLRIKIASAECIGRLRAGLSRAAPMFLPLMSVEDPTAKARVVEAMTRALDVQTRLANQAADRRQEFHNLHLETAREVGEFREKLCELASSDAHAVILRKSSLFSAFDSIMFQMRQDEEYFRAQKDMLLQKHKGEFVAIRDGEILGFAKTRQAIEKLVDDRAGIDARAFVERVSPEAFEQKEAVTIFGG